MVALRIQVSSLFSVELEGAIDFHIVKIFFASLNVTWQAFALATFPTLGNALSLCLRLSKRFHIAI